MVKKITSTVEQIAAALQADCDAGKQSGNGLKTVAAAMDRSYSWAAEMVRGEQPFPLHKLDVWVSLTGGRNFARWVAEKVDCDLVERDESDLEATAFDAMRESTEAAHVAFAALADGEISDVEIAAYKKEMADAIARFRQLDRALQLRRTSNVISEKRPKTLAAAFAAKTLRD
jgi:hypothetical protein